MKCSLTIFKSNTMINNALHLTIKNNKYKQMKTLKSLSLIIILFLLGCSNDDSSQDEKQLYLSRITTTAGSTTYHYDENNRIVMEQFESASGSHVILYKNFYNDNGQLITRTIDNTDSSLDYKYTYHYDTEGYLIKIDTYTIDGSGPETYYSKTEADYSVPGKISVSRTLPTGTISVLYNEYFLDANGNVVMRKQFTPSGVLDYSFEYTAFDNNKSPEQLLPKDTYIKAFNNNLSYAATDHVLGETFQYTFTFEYNQAGYPTKETNSNGSIKTFEYINR